MPTGSFRGGLQVGQILYGAWEGEVYTVDDDGATTLFSTLAGTDNIFIARNNATTPNIAVVTDVGASIIDTTAGAVSVYPSSNVGSPTCVREHMGYFMFGYGNGDIQASGLNLMTLNTLDKARTESNPDGVLNIVSHEGRMYVLGEKTIEVWGDPVNASGFPLTRLGYNITPGLKGKHAVAGWESEFGHAFIYVGSDDTVRHMRGLESVKISPPDLDRLIADVVDADEDLEALVYVAAGHSFWQLNGPNWSWVYNVDYNSWHERRSTNSTKSRLKRSVAAFGRWLVGDTDSTDLLAINHSLATEGGRLITSVLESGPVKDFPNRQRIPRVDFDFTPGVGIATGVDPIQTDPSVLIEISRDGGRTWGTSWVRKLGKQAESLYRVYVLNAGFTGDEGPRWRWTISDSVHVGFTGADMVTELRKK